MINKLKSITSPYYWSELKSEIRNFFFPQNKWLRKLIGKSYCDPCWVVDTVLFATLVHFVEEEDGLNAILNYDIAEDSLKNNYITQDYIDFREPIRKQVEAAYNYIKIIKPQMEQQKEDLHPKSLVPTSDWLIPLEDGSGCSRFMSCEERYGMSYEKAYGPVNDLEEEIKALDTFYMKIIIDNRESLWT
jgi:hypothetical protein